MNPTDAWFKTRRRLIGVVFLLVFALLIWLALALYDKRFTPVALVTLYTSSAGNEMHPGAEVMVRGVQVGEVRQITVDGSAARLELAIQPSMVPLLPANVTAEMLPTTLFGERYVALILPAKPVARRLTAGSVIRENRSRDALELEQVLNNLLPLLTAVHPEQLSYTLTAIAQGLQGRGKRLGQTLVQLNTYLRDLRPHLPALDRDISELARVTVTYRRAAPDIIAALNNFTVVNQTIYQQRRNLAALFSTVTTASGDLRAFLQANSRNIIALSAVSVPTLRILARYAPEFPCTLRALVAFEPNINRVLGAGTKQPGLHVQVHVVPSLGRYLPDKDTPVYDDNLGPHCYSVPFRGIRLHDGTNPPAATADPAGAAARTSRAGTGRVPGSATMSALTAGPGGLANSPQENELINELAGLTLRERPRSLPGWSSLLLGPLYRGTEVRIR
jgi:phospholipid/cholesterol/gamma-HCH transport system substrate-binding protein